MNKRFVVIISLLGLIAFMTGLVFLVGKKVIESKNGIKIYDATMSCAQEVEKFYEDKKYVYYFSCRKSKSVFVELKNGNKMLVVDALDEGLVTIDELMDAGLDAKKQKK
jgi:hypothetical protein